MIGSTHPRFELRAEQFGRFGGISNPRVWGALALVGLLAIVTVLFLFTDASSLLWQGPPEDVLKFECLMIAVIAVAPLLLRVISRQHLDIFEPGVIVSALYLVIFCGRPLLLASQWVKYVEASRMEVFRFLPVSDAAFRLALAYAAVGIAAFHLGCTTWRDPLSVPARATRLQPWSSRRVMTITRVGLVLSAISFILILPVLRSPESLLDEFGRYRELLAGWGYHALGIDMLVVVTLLLWTDHLRGNRHSWGFAVLVISNLYNLLVGSRAGVFNLWIALYLLDRYLRERRLDRWTGKRLVAAGLVIVLAAFTAISVAELRNSQVHDLDGVGKVMRDYWLEESAGPKVASLMLEFNQYDIFALLLGSARHEFPFMFGRSYLEMVYQPIPRALWPQKPAPYDVRIGEMLTGTSSGIPPSIVGELYLNFHVIGILAGMFLFGRLCRLAYRRALASPRDPGRVVIYALLLPYLPLLMLRTFVAVATTALIYTIPAWLALRYVQGERNS